MRVNTVYTATAMLLQSEYGMNVFRNRILRETFGFEQEERPLGRSKHRWEDTKRMLRADDDDV